MMAELIAGKKRFDIIEGLKNDNILIAVDLRGRAYQQLSMVTGIHILNGNLYFTIDYTEGFREAIDKDTGWDMEFSFRGSDHIPYRFRSIGEKIEGKEIYIRFPDEIERIQKRKEFRIEVPLDTKLHFETKDSIRHEMGIIDISLGGMLFILQRKSESTRYLKPGQRLSNIELVFPSETGHIKIYVKRGKVVREYKEETASRYRYAVEFTTIDHENEMLLNKTIIKIQRELLRKRSGTE